MVFAISCRPCISRLLDIFFFTDTPTTGIYTLSLHDALPISTHFDKLFCSIARPACGVQEQVKIVHHRRRSEEHTSELQSPDHLVCRLLLEKKKSTYAAPPRAANTHPPLCVATQNSTLSENTC